MDLKVPENFHLEASACHLDKPCYRVVLQVEDALDRLMPYLNAVAKVIQYEPGDDPVMILKINGYRVALRSREIAIGSVADRQEGAEAVVSVMGFLEDIWQKRDEITPNYKPRRRPPALELYKLLPGTNCGDCGEPACMAFAVKLSLDRVTAEACPYLKKDSKSMKKVGELLGF